jgi:hypothetical protein
MRLLKPINGVSTENSLLRSTTNTSQLYTPRKKLKSKKKSKKLTSKREKTEKNLKNQYSQLNQLRALSLFTSFLP